MCHQHPGLCGQRAGPLASWPLRRRGPELTPGRTVSGYPSKPKPRCLGLPVGGQTLGSPSLYVSKDEDRSWAAQERAPHMPIPWMTNGAVRGGAAWGRWAARTLRPRTPHPFTTGPTGLVLSCWAGSPGYPLLPAPAATRAGSQLVTCIPTRPLCGSSMRAGTVLAHCPSAGCACGRSQQVSEPEDSSRQPCGWDSISPRPVTGAAEPVHLQHKILHRPCGQSWPCLSCRARAPEEQNRHLPSTHPGVRDGAQAPPAPALGHLQGKSHFHHELLHPIGSEAGDRLGLRTRANSRTSSPTTARDSPASAPAEAPAPGQLHPEPAVPLALATAEPQ